MNPADGWTESVAIGQCCGLYWPSPWCLKHLLNGPRFFSKSLSTRHVDQVYMDLADHLVQGLKYICDASLATALFLSKFYVLLLVLRLKCWSADQT